MHWRPFRATDLLCCLDTQPASLGDQIAGRATALGVWSQLVVHPAFGATVIESESPAGSKIIGCGMGVFVDPAFVDRELANPRPGLNARIIAALASGESVLLTREEIGIGNTGAGVDFVNLYGGWREGVLSSPELEEVQTLLGSCFVQHFAGYRFNRVLKEAAGAAGIAFARATGTYRVLAEFAESKSALAVVTPESARAAPYSVAAAIYRYQPPVLRLRRAEQELLAAALAGSTDAELSAELAVSLEAVKKRWLSIFERIDEFKPDLLRRLESTGDARGPQKRHRVVAYVRAHPEELRPYAWAAAKD